MASGRPSSLRHSSPTACGGTSPTLKLGSRSRARATNSWTASDPAMSAAPAAADGQSSGGTVQHTSPGAPSTTRLVTTIRTPGAAPSSWPASAATASRRCSAPSSTISRGASARAAATDSASGTPAWSGTRTPAASAVISDSGWRTVSSGTNVTGTAGAARLTASTASRVLPAPPGPIRVNSRELSSRPTSSPSSRSRPMKLDWATGRAGPRSRRGRERWRCGRRPASGDGETAR